MSELSPAAFAVVDAFVCAHARKSDPSSNADIAAALRAAADQVVPVENTKAKMFEWQRERLIQRLTTRQALLAIANELNP